MMDGRNIEGKEKMDWGFLVFVDWIGVWMDIKKGHMGREHFLEPGHVCREPFMNPRHV